MGIKVRYSIKKIKNPLSIKIGDYVRTTRSISSYNSIPRRVTNINNNGILCIVEYSGITTYVMHGDYEKYTKI